MKDLLDRYLAAVARELPDRQRKDITAELRDELLSVIEAKEDAAGRPLDERELERLLVEFGNPLVVAGRYRRVQHVVGPEIFPLWWAALKVSFAVLAAVYLAIALLQLAFVPNPVVGAAVGELVPTLVSTFGWVTLAAVVIERLGLARAVYRWRPSRLPPARLRGKSPFQTAVEIGMGVIALLWWAGVLHFRDLIPGLGANLPAGRVLVVDLAPVWGAFYWPIFGYLAAEIVIGLLRLIRPHWSAVHAALSLALALGGMVIAVGLLQADHWLAIDGRQLSPEVLAVAQKNFDLGMKLGLVALAVLLAVQAVARGRRLWRAMHEARSPILA